MGRIKSLMVKKAARQLIAAKAEAFNEEFNHNKKVLGNTMPSNHVRNKIAGYISRLIKAKRLESAREAAAAAKAVQIQDEQQQF